tara:strand:- start:6131 stop:6442 length:312 start_codon:yes stop_codon:yes gene_type:complete
MSDSKKPTNNYQSPAKGSSQWKKNESTINNTPAFKKMRDTVEGIQKSDKHYGQTHGGKGSALRTDINSPQYQDNFDKIFKQGKYAPKKEVDPADTTWDDLSDD